MTRSIGSAAELERRRRLAVERVTKDGIPASQVAAVLGVDPSTVHRWVARHREGGAKALSSKPHPGRNRKLAPEQEAAVLGWIARNPSEFGFPDELWTAARIRMLIRKEFGVTFHVNYLCTWLARRRITPQKPQRVAAERDERRVRLWKNTTWPRLEKKGPRSAQPSC